MKHKLGREESEGAGEAKDNESVRVGRLLPVELKRLERWGITGSELEKSDVWNGDSEEVAALVGTGVGLTTRTNGCDRVEDKLIRRGGQGTERAEYWKDYPHGY